MDCPEFDGTDAAHPAWWRGNTHAVTVLCQKINEILDNKDSGAGKAADPWEATRRRLLALVAEARHLQACDDAGLEAMNRQWIVQAEELVRLQDEPYESIRSSSPLGMDGLLWRTRAILAEKEIERLKAECLERQADQDKLVGLEGQLNKELDSLRVECADFHAKLDTPWKYRCGCPAQRDLGLFAFCNKHCKLLEEAFFAPDESPAG